MSKSTHEKQRDKDSAMDRFTKDLVDQGASPDYAQRKAREAAQRHDIRQEENKSW